MIGNEIVFSQIEDLSVRRNPEFINSQISSTISPSGSGPCYLNSFDTCFTPIINDVLPYLQDNPNSSSIRNNNLAVSFETIYDICQGYYKYKSCLQGLVTRCFEYPNAEALVNSASYSKAGTIEYTCNIVADSQNNYRLRAFNDVCRNYLVTCFVRSLIEISSLKNCQSWKNFQTCITDFELDKTCQISRIDNLPFHRENIKKQINISCTDRDFRFPPNISPPSNYQTPIPIRNSAGRRLKRGYRDLGCPKFVDFIMTAVQDMINFRL
ncbi:unnamed protein product [Gordionus sp. m RMFG-2023]